jgi:hypothetical protein
MRLHGFNSVTLGVLVLSVITLSGCADLAVRDTASLLVPRFQRSEILGFVAGFGTTLSVPLVPLALTMMSLDELLKRLIGIVFSMRRHKLGAPGLEPGTPRDNPGALAVDVGNRHRGLKSNGPRHSSGCIVVSCGPAIWQSMDACSAVLALRRR